MPTTSPAEVYDRLFVPALFGPWAERIAALAALSPGHDVLDVACGTGALARAAAGRVGESGTVVGLDVSDEMLGVARRRADTIEWRQGRGEALPFPDGSFDRVVSQFGLMFFEDPTKGLAEMRRVLRPGGAVRVAVCGAIDQSPGYSVLTELLHRLFGPDIAEAFRAPFCMGDREVLAGIACSAGLGDAVVERHDGTVRFDSIDALVSTERACAWTLGGLLDDVQFERLKVAARESLRPFLQPDGTLAFGMPATVLCSS